MAEEEHIEALQHGKGIGVSGSGYEQGPDCFDCGASGSYLVTMRCNIQKHFRGIQP